MSTDTIAVIVTVLLAVGAAYAALARRIDAGVFRLGERLSHVEGLIQGWLNPLPPKVSDQQEKD